MKKNWFFIIVLTIAALSLAGTAAYFSVFGLSKLFAAAGLGIIILAASLEFSKLVTVSYVYRYWKHIKKALKGFYIFAVLFIMLLTSIGIYGFLTGAYQQSANRLEMRDAQIQIAQNKKDLFVGQLARINESITSSEGRINTLTGLRDNQETRLDSLYARNYVTVAKRTEQQIVTADNQIEQLNTDITQKMNETYSVNDSIAFYDQKIIELNLSEVSTEIGPYKFVSELINVPMDRVVNIIALLIILVFDPLAIALLIGINQLTMLKKEEKDEVKPVISEIPKEEIKEKVKEEIKEEEVKEEEVKEEKKKKFSFRKLVLMGKKKVKEENNIVPKKQESEVEKIEPEPIQEQITAPIYKYDDTPQPIQNDDGIEKIASVSSRINVAKFIPE